MIFTEAVKFLKRVQNDQVNPDQELIYLRREKDLISLTGILTVPIAFMSAFVFPEYSAKIIQAEAFTLIGLVIPYLLCEHRISKLHSPTL